MGFFNTIVNWFTQRDIKLSVGTEPEDVEEVIKSRPMILGKSASYEYKGGQLLARLGDGSFVPPPYDLAEIARCADVEPYVAQSIRRHREQILKEGFEIQGQDDDMVEYIRTRLFEIALMSDIPTTNWVREAITNLIQFHSCALIFRRDSSRSSGKAIKMYNKYLDPIAGIYVADPTSMQVKVDKYGTPLRWKQKIGSGAYDQSSTEKTFPPEDVLFITIDKKSGFSYGTPYILPVLEDIRALRKLEELALILANKEAFPLYHYKVGTEQLPATTLEGGGDEVSLVRDEVSNMGIGGNLVTSERHEITLVSKAGAGLDIHPFLTYFEARVLAGLRLSPMELGRGGTSNRGCYSADTETLTDKGWKHYWDINIETDLIATVDPNSAALKFVKANTFHVYPYEGPMYLFSNSKLNVMVTPDHDMWVKIDKGFSKIHADQLTNTVTFQQLVNWHGTIPEHKLFSGIDWPMFLAFFVKFGKVNTYAGEVKLIIRNALHADLVKRFFTGTSLKYRVYDNEGYTKICLNYPDLAQQLNKDFSCRIYPKRLPRYLLDADLDSIEVFFDTLLEFEPCRDILHDRSRTILGQVQEMIYKAGIFSKLTEEGLFVDDSVDDLSVRISTDVTQVPYHGAVYCYNVPNGLFITRREGFIAIHGNTATTMAKNIQDAAKDYQEVFANAITYGLILPLLLEGGFDVDHTNLVSLNFSTIDREELRMHQNHGLQLLLGNGINEDEFRKDYLNKKPMSDEERTLTPRVLDEESQMKLDANAAAVMPTPEAPGEPGPEVTHTVTRKSGTPNRNTTTKKVTKLASNKGQPTNQHGKLQAKPRVAANDYQSAVELHSKDLLDKIGDIISEYYDDEIEPRDVSEDIGTLFKNFVALSVTAAKEHLSKNIDNGANKAAILDSKTPPTIGNRSKEKFFSSYIEKSYWQLLNPNIEDVLAYFKRDADGNTTVYNIIPELQGVMSQVVNSLTQDHLRVSERYGFAKASRTFGYNSIILENSESGERKNIELQTGPIIYKNLIVDVENVIGHRGEYQPRLGTKQDPTNE